MKFVTLLIFATWCFASEILDDRDEDHIQEAVSKEPGDNSYTGDHFDPDQDDFVDSGTYSDFRITLKLAKWCNSILKYFIRVFSIPKRSKVVKKIVFAVHLLFIQVFIALTGYLSVSHGAELSHIHVGLYQRIFGYLLLIGGSLFALIATCAVLYLTFRMIIH